MMSHNSKYYVKRLKKKDTKGLVKMTNIFKKRDALSKQNEVSSSQPPSEMASESEIIPTTSCAIIPSTSCTSVISSESQGQSVVFDSERESEEPASHLETSFISTKGMDTEYNDSETEVCMVPDQRKFAFVKYESNYPWIYYSTVKGGYICKYCEMFCMNPTSNKAFVTKGVQLGSHPTRVLQCHQSSNSHKGSVERYTLSRSNVNVLRQLTLKADKKKQYNRSIVKKIFQCVDFLIRQKWAVTENTEKFVKFVARLGVQDLQQHIGDTVTVKYLSSNSVTQMVTCISSLIEKQLLQEIQGQEFALLADESSDVAHRSQMSVMARFAKSDMTVATHFLGFVQLEKGTAEAIMNSLQGFLLAKGINMTQIRFMAFDGCNTMSGIQKGLQRRIRHINPFAIYINCRNHRLALCLVHLIKKFPILQAVDSTLLSLWKLFEYSPQRMAVFKHIQVVYGKEQLTITKAAATRWLSHLQASARFISRYSCILDTLDSIYSESKEPEILGIRLATTEKKTVATILLLCDILKPVNMLSLYLQEENINFTSLPVHVKETTDTLHALIDKYKVNFEDTEFDKCGDIFDEIDDRTDLERRMRRHREILTPPSFLTEIGIPLIYDLIMEIEDAFCTGAPVLNSFGFFVPQNLPENVVDLADYGKDSIQKMVEFYAAQKVDTFLGHRVEMAAIFDPVQLQTELQNFKIQLFMMSSSDNDTLCLTVD